MCDCHPRTSAQHTCLMPSITASRFLVPLALEMRSKATRRPIGSLHAMTTVSECRCGGVRESLDRSILPTRAVGGKKKNEIRHCRLLGAYCGSGCCLAGGARIAASSSAVGVTSTLSVSVLFCRVLVRVVPMRYCVGCATAGLKAALCRHRVRCVDDVGRGARTARPSSGS